MGHSANVTIVKSTYHIKFGSSLPVAPVVIGQQSNAAAQTVQLQPAQIVKIVPKANPVVKNVSLAPIGKLSVSLHPFEQSSFADDINTLDLPISAARMALARATAEAKPSAASQPSKSLEAGAAKIITLLPVAGKLSVATASKPGDPPPGEDSKVATKNFPSLFVTVRPSRTLAAVVNQKKRESLGKRFIFVLILSPSESFNENVELLLLRQMLSLKDV